jgi:hypothetical protein
MNPRLIGMGVRILTIRGISMRTLKVSPWIMLLAVCGCIGKGRTVRQVTAPDASLAVSRVDIPSEVVVGEKFETSVKTSPGNSCWIAFRYEDADEGWIFQELEEDTADQDGLCRWYWTVPKTANPGIARASIVIFSESGTNMFVPHPFCIKECEDCVRKCPRSPFDD